MAITDHGKGLMLVILRYPEELRDPNRYFENIPEMAETEAVKLATDLIEQQAGKFEPEKMPNEYARAVHELVRAKVEQRKPEVVIEPETGQPPKVINIMAALKQTMQTKSHGKIGEGLGRRLGKASSKLTAKRPATPQARPSNRKAH